MHLGKSVHAGLAELYKGRGLDVARSEFLSALENGWSSVKHSDGSKPDFKELKIEGYTLIDSYDIASDFEEWGKPLAVEDSISVDVSTKIEGVYLPLPLMGVPDVVFRGPVIDHKIVSSPLDDDYIQNDLQRVAYSFLYEALTGERESSFIYNQIVRRKGVPRRIRRQVDSATDVERRMFAEVAKDVLSKIERGDFQRNPHARRHDYELLCM